MHEYTDKNPSNQSGGSYTSGNQFITYPPASPRIKRVTVTESLYDENGNVIKETVTETEYVEAATPPYNPNPWNPYVWTSTSGYTVPDPNK